MKKVVVFGIFDGVHDGHRDLFTQALRQAQGKLARDEVELIVIVGRDSIAEKLKGKFPKYSEADRVEMLKQEKLVDQVVLGDKELSSYKVLGKLNPDAVCVGYDQEDLEQDLRKWVGQWNITIYRAKPHKEDTFHSSLLTEQ